MNAFFLRIDSLRREKGVTLKEIGRICGISPQGIQTWKRAKSVPVEHISTLAEYFGVTVDWLLGRDDQGASPYPFPTSLQGAMKLQKGRESTSGHPVKKLEKGPPDRLGGAAAAAALARQERERLGAFGRMDEARVDELVNLVRGIAPAMTRGENLDFCEETLRTGLESFVSWCRAIAAEKGGGEKTEGGSGNREDVS